MTTAICPSASPPRGVLLCSGHDTPTPAVAIGFVACQPDLPEGGFCQACIDAVNDHYGPVGFQRTSTLPKG